MLHRDLQRLRERGVHVGRARRWRLHDDPWSLPPAHHYYERYDDPWCRPDTDRDDADENRDSARYIPVRLYDEDDLFDVDPFDPFHLDPIETA